MKKNTNFKYWHNVLELETNILVLVRSLRQSNLLLFISTLQHLAPVFFTLDVGFIQDLLCLTLFREFMGGSFAVKGGSQWGKMGKNGEKWGNFFMGNWVKKLGNSPFFPTFPHFFKNFIYVYRAFLISIR